MTRHPTLLALIAALALGAGAIGCGGEDDDSGSPPPDYSVLAKAPGALGKLYAEGDALLGGGIDAFGLRLDELRGTPVVVNKWASWCVPCRVEFPYFQRQAAKHGNEIAFLGVNSLDSDDAAETFLRDHPLPYPSYIDGDESLAEEIGAAPGFPATVFFDEETRRAEVHIGQYSSERELAADIRRYAG